MKNARQRQNARKLLIQALYSLDLGGSTPAKIEKDFLAEKSMSRVDEKFFHNALHFIAKNLSEIDHAYAVALDRDSICLLYTSPSPRDTTASRMPSSA